MDIKGIPLSGSVVFGPMAGITSLAYRDFMKPFGVALSVSEMISDCGLIYGNAHTESYLATSKSDRPVALQLFGFNAENVVKAIDILEKKADFEILDINLGCPVHKVTKTGAGSAWLKNPEALYEYMRAIVRASHHPVSAKIRLGWDEKSINVWEVAKGLEAAGIALLSVHARTAVQGYSGFADFSRIAGLGEQLSIPLCVSGDIFSPEAALEAMRVAKASLVMLARGAEGNPELVTNINRALRGESLLPPPGLIKQATYAKNYALLLEKERGSYLAALALRGILPSFFKGFPGYKRIRTELALHTHSFDEVIRVLDGVLKRAEF